MKLFKYNQFINESKQSREDIDSICRKYNIRNYVINDDGTVDVDNNVYLENKGLTRIPLKFGKVTGSFNCSYNKLISLDGSPIEVDEFYCGENGLTSLKGGPKETRSYFSCTGNELTSLEGSPNKILGNFNCYLNDIRDFKGFPKIFNGFLFIGQNPIYEVYKLFEEKSECIEFLNEYDVIRDGNKIILQALELVYDELGLEVPENIEIKGYEII